MLRRPIEFALGLALLPIALAGCIILYLMLPADEPGREYPCTE